MTTVRTATTGPLGSEPRGSGEVMIEVAHTAGCGDAEPAGAVLRALIHPDFLADAQDLITHRFHRFRDAWDYDAYREPADRDTELARLAVSELLTALGFGTPTMRAELCGVEFTDGMTCIFGRHHEVAHHLSRNGQHLPAVVT